MSISTGKFDFHYHGTKYQTWYKITGDLHPNKPGVRPLVALHGGPGVSHSYMTPHIDLFASYDIPIILYDQIGAGESTHCKDAPKDFWTVDLFMDELENLLENLGISEDYDIVGHSWGGMLAGNFAAARQPKGLKHLVVADSPASMALWEESTAELMRQFPPSMQSIVQKHERDGTTDTPEYQEAMMIFYKQHLCRLDPWPEDLSASFASMEVDPTVYQTMQGPSEFTITGTLKTWSIVNILHKIKYPTLMINSVYDEAQDICMLPYFKHVPKVKWVQFANSSHVPFFEERDRYMKVVGNFLTSI